MFWSVHYETQDCLPTTKKKNMSSPRRLSMDHLPEDVMIDILSRLPVGTIINCKCVCKRWRNLVSNSHFVHLQILRSPECLLIYHFKFIDLYLPPGTLKLVEIENKLDHNRLLRDPFISFDTAPLFPESIISPVGSVNGLICLWELSEESDNTYICNPITKEYMILPKQQFDVDTFWDIEYGFGVSATGEYKVIRLWRRDPSKTEVYTLGTDNWRTLGQVPNRLQLQYRYGLFFNNHVHWIAKGQLFSFNLEDETFQFSSLPRPLYRHACVFLGVLKGCLSLFSSINTVATIWLMEEHGIKKPWRKELEIKEDIIPYPNWLPLSLIDGLDGRSILFFVNSIKEENRYRQLLAYCLETNTIGETKLSDNLFKVITYRPSFLKLQNSHPAIINFF